MNTQNPQSAPETRTDPEGNIWVGNFDENFTGEGEVTNLNKTVIKGEFRNGILVRGKATLQNGDTWVVIMTEGDSMNGKGMMTLNNQKKEIGEFRNRQLIHGTIRDINSDEIIYIENGVPVERPTPAPEVVAIPTSEPEEPNVALADRPITDGLGNVWVGNFDENFTGEGSETRANKLTFTGKFRKGNLTNGTVKFPDGDVWTVDMIEGNYRNGRGKWRTNRDIQEGEFVDGNITNGTVTVIETGEVLYWENGMQVARPTVTSEPEEPNVALADRPIRDRYGNVWVGNFDENFTGDGIVTNPTNGAISRGRFHNGDLVDGTWTINEHVWTVKKTDDSRGKQTMGLEMREGIFTRGSDGGILMDGTITDGRTGKVSTRRNGIPVDDLSPAVPTTAESGVVTTTSPLPERAFTFSEADFPDIFGPATGSTFSPFASTTPAPAPEPTPRTPREYINPPIKYIQIRDQNLYVRDKKGKLTILPGVEEAIDRVSNLREELPEDVRHRISALGQGNIIFKKIVPADGMLTRLLKRNKQGEPEWITMESKWGETVITIDPFHLPKDDNKIKRTISILATMFDDQKKIEDLVNDINTEFAIKLISGNFDHGSISFSKSLPGVEKIKNAILKMGLTIKEGDILAQSNILVLMHGQKREDYANGKYKIIIECDTSMDEQQIAEYIRREIDRVDKEGVNSPKRSLKTPKGVFGKIRNRMGSILLGTGILAGGGIGVNYVANDRPAPVAPETPEAGKPEPKKAEVVKPPEPPAAKPEAAEKSPATTGMGETVKFTTTHDGMRMGFLKKVGKKYKAIPKFKLFQKDKDGNFSVKRIEK